MIVVPVKEGENIEKALKKFKRKFVLKRLKMERAIYVQKLHQVEE